MDDDFSLNKDKLYMFFINKLIDLETDIKLQQIALKATLLHVLPDKKNVVDTFFQQVYEQRSKHREDIARDYFAQMKGGSDEMDDFLKGLFD